MAVNSDRVGNSCFVFQCGKINHKITRLPRATSGKESHIYTFMSVYNNFHPNKKLVKRRQ